MPRSLLLAPLLIAYTAGAQSFRGIGVLPETSQTLAMGTSNDGAVIVGYGEGLEVVHPDRAQIWTPQAGLRLLQNVLAEDFGTDTTGWALERAVDVSPDGAVIVGDGVTGGERRAFRWTAAAGLVDLGTLGGGLSVGSATSDDGAVVVGRSWPDGATHTHAFRWTPEAGMVDLGTLGGVTSAAYGLSGDGRVAFGTAEDADGIARPVRWVGTGEPQFLGSLHGSGLGAAFGSSPDGRVIVGTSATEDNVREAFRWIEGRGMIGLGLLDGGRVRARASRALATSADGRVIVGGVLNVGGYYQAFAWTEADGMRLLQDILVDDYGLDLDGWLLVKATSISEDGSVIVGYGFNPEGVYEGWRAEVRLVTSEEAARPARRLRLEAAPNPAGDRALLTVRVEMATAARVTIYDGLGRRVAIVHDGPLTAGSHRLPVDVRGLPSGLYLVRAEAGGPAVSQPLTVVR
jgi:probable HAF family extracellular repeat protein